MTRWSALSDPFVRSPGRRTAATSTIVKDSSPLAKLHLDRRDSVRASSAQFPEHPPHAAADRPSWRCGIVAAMRLGVLLGAELYFGQPRVSADLVERSPGIRLRRHLDLLDENVDQHPSDCRTGLTSRL
jgi:hypothetical protein